MSGLSVDTSEYGSRPAATDLGSWQLIDGDGVYLPTYRDMTWAEALELLLASEGPGNYSLCPSSQTY